MFTMRICLLFVIAVIVTANCKHHRMRRSPDKMEVDIPTSSELDSKPQEHHDQLNEEGEYWHEKGGNYFQAGNDRNKTMEENHEKYEIEKEYREDQQQSNNKEADNKYNNNKEELESQHKENKDHHNEQLSDNDVENKGNETKEELNTQFEDIGERYEEKERENMNDRQEEMENYDAKEKGPSFTYQKD